MIALNCLLHCKRDQARNYDWKCQLNQMVLLELCRYANPNPICETIITADVLGHFSSKKTANTRVLPPVIRCAGAKDYFEGTIRLICDAHENSHQHNNDCARVNERLHGSSSSARSEGQSLATSQ
jgi:hypothetical protein